MRNLQLIALLLFPLLFLSCDKDEQKPLLVGTWRFEKVTYHRDFALSKTDLTDLYQGIELVFYDDQTFLYTHAGRKIDLTGYWDLYSESNEEDEHNSSSTRIDWYGEDASSNLEEGKWDNVQLKFTSIRATERKNNGTYTFRLARVF